MEITLEVIQNTIWQLRTGSAQHAEKQRNYLKYDGSYCRPEVRSHLKALEMIRNQILGSALCICPEEVAAIYYGAKAYLGHACADPVPDYVMQERSDAARWVLENPDCVLYEYWVDYLRSQCKKVGLDLDVKVKECKSIGLDVKVAYQEACAAVLLDFQVTEIKCDFGIDITVEELQSCKVDYDFYVKPLNCDISLSTFVRALNCGVDVNTLVKEIQCGHTLNFTAEGVEFCPADEVEIDEDITVDPPIEMVSCLYNNDLSVLSGLLRVNSFIVNGVEYQPFDDQLGGANNNIMIGPYSYNAGWVDAMNARFVESEEFPTVPNIVFEYPSEADLAAVEAIPGMNPPSLTGPHTGNCFRMTLPAGSTFTLVQYLEQNGEGISTSELIQRITESVSEVSFTQGNDWIGADEFDYLFDTMRCVTVE